jgi:hypothetical protein
LADLYNLECKCRKCGASFLGLDEPIEFQAIDAFKVESLYKHKCEGDFIGLGDPIVFLWVGSKDHHV